MVIQALQVLDTRSAIHEGHLFVREAEVSHSSSDAGLFGFGCAPEIHPLDLHIMQVVLEEVLEKGKLRLVDAGRHCEGRDFGLLPLHVLRPNMQQCARCLLLCSFLLLLACIRPLCELHFMANRLGLLTSTIVGPEL